MRVGVWCDRKPSKRNCRASEQSKGSFHLGSFVAQPHSFPGDWSSTVKCSPGFTRVGNGVTFSQKLYLCDQANNADITTACLIWANRRASVVNISERLQQQGR
jgi:hypothetical protein